MLLYQCLVITQIRYAVRRKDAFKFEAIYTTAIHLLNIEVIVVIIEFIDDPNSKALVKQYNIGATPTTIFINPEGKVIDYAVGKVEKTKFLEMLENQKRFSEK